MDIRKLNKEFMVCKVRDFSQVDLDDEFVFLGKTDEEKSVVCTTSLMPKNVLEYENGWYGFRIEGVLDFSLVGILAKISSLLAERGISIYAVSTFNTDYIFIKKEKYDEALDTLSCNGYSIK